MSILERGFKTWSERVSAGIRRELGLVATAPLPPVTLAEYLGVTLWTPTDVPGLQPKVAQQLLEIDPGGWSATAQEVDGQAIVVYNPRHSMGRQAADITHELAHLLLGHEPAQLIVSPDGAMAMRSYNRTQEDEASWLAACLLLPRVALVSRVKAGKTAHDIAGEFGVSEALATYRIRTCGVDAQVRAMKRARRAG
jgi:hypothetical protein